jgi:hypothetical protein
MGQFNQYSDGVAAWRGAEKKDLLSAEHRPHKSAAFDREGP